ncbi:MAG: short-chain fatty acids transporter [Planctomycetota bacterium]|jgi:short-chain fatty acids transporter
MKIAQLVVRPFVVLVERFYPDPFVFAIILTFVTIILSLGLTDAGPQQTILAWGDGLSSLFAFTSQICITLIAAHALSHTDAVKKALAFCGSLPGNQVQAYALVVVVSGLCSLMAWSLGLVAGALLAKEVAIQCQQKKITLHYPLLVAAAYSGFVVWHMGYSGSATLSVATPGHPLEDMMGILPVTETMLSPLNILLALVTISVVALACILLRPAEEDVIQVDIKQLQRADDLNGQEETTNSSTSTFASCLDNMRALNISVALLFAIYLALWFSTMGFVLNLNVVNWSFVCLGLLLANSPVHYIKLLIQAGGPVGLIILQYPFYAGILGIMKGTGLVTVFSTFFTEIANTQTLPFFAFLAGGLINMFVPSGGGQWVIQGPIFIEAAKTLNVDPALIVLGVAYGDQWTNMIQPFWTIPVLAIAGLHLRQIMGYTFLIFVLTFFLFGGALLFLY